MQCLHSVTMIILCVAPIVPKLASGNPFILVLCPFDMTIKCFFAFWDKKKAFLPSGTGSLSSLELISIFLW